MILNIAFDFFNVIDNVISYISTLLSFITSMCSVVVSSLVIFFVNLPSWISGGFLSVFSLGIIILIVKLVR